MSCAFGLVLLGAVVQLVLNAPVQAIEGESTSSNHSIRLENLTANEVLAVAGLLIDAGRYDDAKILLDRLAADNAGGLERDFLDAMVAMARKDYVRAESLLRRILAGDPGLVRVRLELARTLFLMKKDEDADYHFRLAIAQDPPKAVIANIARFREAIRTRRAWRFNVNFGIAPDSNINSATDKERVDILGLPFRIDPASRARSGTGIFVGGDTSIRIFRNRKVPVYVAAFGHMVRYSDHDFDDIYFGGEAGPEFRVSGGRLRLAVTGLNRWYGDQQLVRSLGGRLNFDKIIAGKWGIEASLAVRQNAYARRSDVDGWDIEAGISANRALSPSAFGFAFTSLQRSNARDPGYSSWSSRIGVGAHKEIGWGLRPQLSVEASRQVNDVPLGIFGKSRRDWRLQATASIYKRDWNVAGFAPSVRATWSRSLSTINLYDQKRLRAEIGITKAF